MKAGDVVKARAKTITQFGVWIEWDDHEALVLISEASERQPPIRHPRDVLEIGQEVTARIVKVNPDGVHPRFMASLRGVGPLS